MAARDDVQQPADRDTEALREPAYGPADISNDVLGALTEDLDRMAHDLNDTVVHQMFAVSLDLYAALSRIDHDTDNHHATEKIHHAITGLDQAINDLRSTVVGFKSALEPPGGRRAAPPLRSHLRPRRPGRG